MMVNTLPETNIVPENGWLEYWFPFGKAYFQGKNVSFWEGNPFIIPEFHASSGIRERGAP